MPSATGGALPKTTQTTGTPAMKTTPVQDCWRSEAFAEDLFDFTETGATQGARLRDTLLLCLLPLAVALAGGVMAFLHSVG
jgi:hypothetical protein